VLLARYATTHDAGLEAELLGRLTPLAMSLARRYRAGGDQDEDLRQIASIGLVKALRRYDPAVSTRFAAFASPTILGELRRYFRDHSWRLRVPRGIKERSMSFERASAELTHAHGRPPTAEEVAVHAGMAVEDVLEALVLRETQQSVSLDVRSVWEGQEASSTLGDSIGRTEPGFDRVESQMAVESCAGVSQRERKVIELRFVDELNQYEIAERLGISQMQVSRVLRRGLARMLEAVQGDDSPDGRKSLEDTTPDARFPVGRTRVRAGSPVRAA